MKYKPGSTVITMSSASGRVRRRDARAPGWIRLTVDIELLASNIVYLNAQKMTETVRQKVPLDPN